MRREVIEGKHGRDGVVWLRTASISAALFFVFFSDATLSYWVPGFLQDSLSSSFKMGLVISFSSLVGLVADLVLPQLLRGARVKKLVVLGVITGWLFGLTLLFTTWWPIVALMLIAMGVWGIYYEFFGFADGLFVANYVPVRQRSGAWAIIGIFKNLAYFLGPFLAGRLILIGDRTLLVTAMIFTLIGFVVFLLVEKRKEKEVVYEVEAEHVSLIKEMRHWWILLERVWPVLMLSLILGIIDATYWTTGAVFTEKLAEMSWWGQWFLPMYILPSLFMGLVMLKWGIYKGKKKLAEQCLLVSGIFLALMVVSNNIVWLLAMVIVSSVLSAVSFPLVDAVYTDISVRMGRERKHMIGLSRSTLSFAYIIGPILTGLITNKVGERMTFVVIGVGVVVTALYLLMVTPKKLKLPQNEIEKWEG